MVGVKWFAPRVGVPGVCSMNIRIPRSGFPGIAGLVLLSVASTARADDWPQWLGPSRDGVWRETGILDKFPPGGPKIKWRTPIGGGFAGPAVAGGKVYVADRILAPGVKNPDNPFSRKENIPGSERVLCLDETDGHIVWRYEYDCPYVGLSYATGPRCTPLIAGGKVYALGAVGNLVCLDAAKGTRIWSKDLLKEYGFDLPGWGFAGHPLLDGDRLICLVGAKGAVVVAFNKDTGAEVWKNLSAKEPGYAPPMIFEQGGKRLLIVWHPESINALDPVTGKLYWSQQYGDKKSVGAGMTIPTPRLAGDLLYFSAFYAGSVMLKLHGSDRPEILWKAHGRDVLPEATESLHCVMSTPYIKDGYIYGADSYGEFRCLDLKTGERIWSTYEPITGKSTRWGNVFIVPQGDRVVLFNEMGDLIIARLSPKGYEEISRAHILEPRTPIPSQPARHVIWSHPAFADRCVFARGDEEIVCVSMAK
jgi:outer membrane protein assembly factor BamB